ncbi:MAG: anthranilate synthase component I family protein [Rothia sp. (in: high G+C Gram-positive bacteria)]|uniref:anthranilate synthase component I family protein n=1 Tax=Rothia sp. (in: high G+C Gram-positive bacteria) TaxID=1885016 RepID=UPI0026DB0B1E|nr:anthranilate synthase component I family protein [Rothia sp. (in: high G+C Gram-positive bacteria)]MDO4883404.1 anthranilate synthase component I family protein [Rothia sp. (in: high G+C Gram-positive bacteria)]
MNLQPDQYPPLHARALDVEITPQVAYPVIAEDARYAFWLDSAREESPMSRFSYVGVVPDWAPVLRIDNARAGAGLNPWDALDTALSTACVPVNASELPEGLRGGYVGYFGYEARAALHPGRTGYTPRYAARTPDSLWMPAVRYLAYEHKTRRVWLVGDEAWLGEIEPRLRAAAQEEAHREISGENEAADDHPAWPLHQLSFEAPDSERYCADIMRAQRHIYEGNSYEVCLSAETAARAERPLTPNQLFDLYRAQRQHNPAPYAAYLRCGDFSVLSSSPERFLRVDTRGRAETKPIKGTISRGAHPQEDAAVAHWLQHDAKTRAENLMIVDLLRNDLSMVSDPASVRVPVLMGVESYATVHQLVSTVTAQLKPGVSAVQASTACFPGGSMTGAPKPSTMNIIEELEARPRGVYSGALGFFSADGSADLSIVIRTLVAHENGLVTLAAGGAIVADSDPRAEYEEMLTKLRAALPGSVGRIVEKSGASGQRPGTNIGYGTPGLS